MVLDKRRGWVSWIVDPVAHSFRHVDPNIITWISLPFAIAGGLLFWYSGEDQARAALWVFLGLAAVGMASLLDLMDGRIARTYGKLSKKGDYLDHVIDRFADVVLFAGVAFSAWADLRVGFFAITGVLLTSYMGTQAQAIGIGRNYGGILGRADRLALLSIASVAEIARHLGLYSIPPSWHLMSAFDAMLWWFAIAGNLTAIQRFFQGLKWLDENPSK